MPVPGFKAATKKKATLNNTSGSMSLIGIPVSMFSCARAPFPVMISPINEKAIPNCANLPTKSSFDFVNPNNGPTNKKIQDLIMSGNTIISLLKCPSKWIPIIYGYPTIMWDFIILLSERAFQERR